MRKSFKLLLLLALFIFVFTGCTEISIDKSKYTQIKFNEMYETTSNNKDVSQKLKLLNGQKVLLSGYMAEQSPVDESFIYLVSQPYVVCPFCTLGDITKLDVMSVYMANGTGITFRTNAVEIYGTLEVEAKEDAFGYTTQFRIIADRIENLEESSENEVVNSYYNTLNDAGMILDIQQLQMNIDSLTNPDTMAYYYGTEPIEIVNGIKADEMWDNIDEYVVYIKECPDIVSACEPEDEKLKAINEELISLYNKEIVLLEKIAAIVKDIKTTDKTNDEKVKSYNELVSYKDENLKLFDEFNVWNNKLRE